jgi:hypothetical protein
MKDSLRSHLRPLLTNSHSPHPCPTPGVYTFTVTQFIDYSTSLPGIQQQARQELAELCSCYWIPSRRIHFLNTLSHLERVSHRPNNLPLQSTGLTTRPWQTTGLTTCFFYPAPKTNEQGWRQQKNSGKAEYDSTKYRCTHVTEVHDGHGFNNGKNGRLRAFSGV